MGKSHKIASNQLDGVVAFLLVAERRSFRAAASELNVSPSAISQTIRTLEARVGVALISRTTRSVGLTEAGQRFLEHARPGADAFAAAFEAARSLAAQPSGLLRITAPKVVASLVIEPVLADFCKAHPEVEVEIVADSRLVDIVEEGFDAGVRLAEDLQADMIGVRLSAPFRFCIAGAPAYLDQHGRPQRPEDLVDHQCIRFRRPTSGAIYKWEFQDNQRDYELSVDGPLIVNDEMLVLSAAVRGLGLTYVAEPRVAAHVRDGRLETVLDAFMPDSDGVFLYYPSSAQALPKLRAFSDFMRQAANRRLKDVETRR